MRDHEKHASQYVASTLAYHFGWTFRIIFFCYIYSPSFVPSSSVSYLSRNRAVSHSYMIPIVRIAYIPMYSFCIVLQV